MSKVAVLDDWHHNIAEHADWNSLGREVVFFADHVTDDDLVDRLQGFDIVVATRERTAFPKTVIACLPDLRLLVSTGRTNKKIDMAAASAAGVVVSVGVGEKRPAAETNAPPGTAELAWALILAGMRNIALEDRSMRAGKWQVALGENLIGKRLGLIGLGLLGSAMVPVAHVFGMEVVAWSENLTAERAAQVNATAVSKDELLETAHVISIHLQLSDRTRGLIGAKELAQMSRGALLVNTSRGPIIDEAALISALRSGAIKAALDVYDIEPLPAGHPLTTLDNVVLAPHLGYVSLDAMRSQYGQAIDCITAFLSGAPINVMNPSSR